VIRRILSLLAVVALLVAGPGAAPALADFRVLASTPAAGATLTMPPVEVRISFDQPVNDELSSIQVRPVGKGSGAASAYADLYNSGLVRSDGATALVQSVRLLPSGTYEVAWTAGAGAGTPTSSGKFQFTVAAPAEPGAGIGQWAIIGLMAVVIVFLAVNLGRRRIDRRALKAQPKDTGKAQPKDTGKAQPKDTGKAQPKDTGKAQPKDTGKAQPKDTGKAQPKGTRRT
jgi:methionine-rich copper-binding protein CopC